MPDSAAIGTSTSLKAGSAPVTEMRRDCGLGMLLCRPDFFGVEYEINPYMHLEIQADRELAISQWEHFRDTLRAAGCEVVEQAGAPSLPDMVFTNNAGLVVENRALLTRFRHPERAGEEEHFRSTFHALGFEVVELPAHVTSFEGAADAVAFGGRVICGYGPRTDERAHEFIADFMGLPLLDIPLVDERFYHLDLAFCKLDEQTAIVSKVATTPEALAELLEITPQAIVLDEAETLAFCANAAVVGKTVYMHEVPGRVGDEMRRFGFEPVEVPVGEFLKAGGSLGCMSLILY